MKQVLPILALLMFTSAVGQNQRAGDASPYSIAPRAADGRAPIRGGGPPANDDCANAQSITLTTDCFNPIEGDNTEATSVGPDASCDDPGGTLLDVWYTFTTGAVGPVAISLIGSAAMTDRNYVLYEGGCSDTEVACRIAPVFGQQEVLLPATQYWLRVYSNPSYGTPGAFTLCIQDLASVPAPANDDCANVSPSQLNIGGDLTFTGDATYALNSEGLPLNSIWNAFTLSEAADVDVDLCGTTASLGIFWTFLYVTCPADVENRIGAGSYDFGTCGNNVHLCYGNLPAGTYYYAVNNGSTPGTYTVNVQASAVGTSSPPNDDCAGAIPLTVGSSCTPINYAPSCASSSNVTDGCVGGAAWSEDDVWYSFTATAADMAVGMFPHSTQFGPILEVFSGTCGALTSIGCANGFAGDTLEVALDGLTVGSSYYVQVYNGYFGTPADDASYDLCVVEGTGIGIGVQEHGKDGTLDLFPNPNNGDFTVRTYGGARTITFELVDATGRSVMTDVLARSSSVQVHLGDLLRPGLYVVRTNDGTVEQRTRMIVR